MSSDAVSLLLMKYEQNARDWDQAVSDVRKANALFDRTHGLYKRLRANREGRLGIAALLTDPNPGVRVMAATTAQNLRPFCGFDGYLRFGGVDQVTCVPSGE